MRFIHATKVLIADLDNKILQELGIKLGSTIVATIRICGGGGFDVSGTEFNNLKK